MTKVSNHYFLIVITLVGLFKNIFKLNNHLHHFLIILRYILITKKPSSLSSLLKTHSRNKVKTMKSGVYNLNLTSHFQQVLQSLLTSNCSTLMAVELTGFCWYGMDFVTETICLTVCHWDCMYSLTKTFPKQVLLCWTHTLVARGCRLGRIRNRLYMGIKLVDNSGLNKTKYVWNY